MPDDARPEVAEPPVRRFALHDVADLHDRCVPSLIGLSANHIAATEFEGGAPGMAGGE